MPRSLFSPSLSARPRPEIGIAAACLVVPMAAVLALLLLPSSASADWLELEARYWAPDLSGGSSVEAGSSSVSVDFGDDLGLDVDESLEGRLTIRPGLGFFLRGRFQNLSAAGDQAASLPIEIEGQVFQLTVDTATVLDFDYAGVALGWQFRGPDNRVRVGPFVEAKGVRGDASIFLSAFGVSEGFAEDFEAGFAAAGGLLEIQPSDRLQLFAEISVLIEDDEADLTDWEAGLRFFVNDTLGLGVGYRSFSIDGEIDDVPLDLEYEGGFGTLLLRF